MNGSGGDTGYDFQANAFAFVAAHALAEQPLGWFDDLTDTPVAIEMETGGPGDDLKVDLSCGTAVEVQVKYGLRQGRKFREAMLRLGHGLKDSPELRGVLFVDSTTSGPIRDQLSKDIIRVGEGRSDYLKPITEDIVSLLAEHGIPVGEICKRLRIVCVNLTAGSNRVLATALLTNIVKTPDQAHTAWRILGKEGHRLTTTRGRRDGASLTKLLGRYVELSSKSSNEEVTAEYYRKWVAKANETFWVPGLSIHLPISEAWNRLHLSKHTSRHEELSEAPLAEQVAAYHEWERLADEREYTSSIAAEDVVHSFRQTAIVGGPGAGKSTMLRRLAHWAAQEGNIVFRVPLRIVARMVEGRQTFEQAVCQVAAGSSGIDERTAGRLLSRADYLLADGLDECDLQRETIADLLTSWAKGHADCHVCVTTRPVGHHPELLRGFKHAELPPLNRTAVRQHADRLFEAAIDDPTKAADLSKKFHHEVLDEQVPKKVATIAARNPLLLTFLISLFIEGVVLTGKRADLFERIFGLIRDTGQIGRVHATQVRQALAMQVIGIIGWILIDYPGQTMDDIVRAAVSDLTAGIRKPDWQLEDEVRQAIRFWEERGLLKRLTVEHLDTLTFVHLSLGEYAAGCYIGDMSDDRLQDWLDNSRREDKWREPILLAAGSSAVDCIVKTLLELDNAEDPTSTEAALAAAAVIEAAEPDDELIAEVVEHLQARIESDIPLVAVEAAQGLIPLANLSPELIGPIAKPLTDHDQPWTRLGAVAVALTAGPEYMSLDEVTHWLDSFQCVRRIFFGEASKAEPMMPGEAYDLQAAALPLAMEKLLVEMGTADAEQYIEQFLSNQSISWGISWGMFNNALHLLERYGCSDLAAKLSAPYFPDMGHDFASTLARSREAEASFLKMLLAATGCERQRASGGPKLTAMNVAFVFTAMHLWEVGMRHVLVLAKGILTDETVEVIRGVIAALDLDTTSLAQETNELLAQVEQGDEDFFDAVPRVPTEPDWTNAVDASLDTDKIVRALSHPSRAIAFTAAELLAAGVQNEDTPSMILDALSRGRSFTLDFIGIIAEAVWGKQAASILLDRLDISLGSGCEYLYEHIARLAGPDNWERVGHAILEGCFADSPEIAAGAATAISELPEGTRTAMLPKLRGALDHWTQRGSWCEDCNIPVHDGSCPDCHVVPPNPRPHLVRELARLGQMSVNELLALCDDSWREVGESAVEALAHAADNDRRVMVSLLEKIASGEASLRLFNALIPLDDEVIRPVTTELLELSQSPVPRVRARLLSSLTGGWVDTETAVRVNREALSDESPAVRSAATRTLRLLYTSRP